MRALLASLVLAGPARPLGPGARDRLHHRGRRRDLFGTHEHLGMAAHRPTTPATRALRMYDLRAAVASGASVDAAALAEVGRASRGRRGVLAGDRRCSSTGPTQVDALATGAGARARPTSSASTWPTRRRSGRRRLHATDGRAFRADDADEIGARSTSISPIGAMSGPATHDHGQWRSRRCRSSVAGSRRSTSSCSSEPGARSRRRRTTQSRSCRSTTAQRAARTDRGRRTCWWRGVRPASPSTRPARSSDGRSPERLSRTSGSR